MLNIKGLQITETENECWGCSFEGKIFLSKDKKMSREGFVRWVNDYLSRPYRVEESLGLNIYLIPANFMQNRWLIVRQNHCVAMVLTDSSKGLWKDGVYGVRQHVLAQVKTQGE